MTHLLVEETKPIPLGTIGGDGTGLGPFGGQEFTSETALTKFTDIISTIIGFLTVVAALWFLIQVILGGIGWMTAAGDKGKLTEARDRLSNAVIGLVIVVASWAILALVGQFLGWDTILLPVSILNNITFQ